MSILWSQESTPRWNHIADLAWHGPRGNALCKHPLSFLCWFLEYVVSHLWVFHSLLDNLKGQVLGGIMGGREQEPREWQRWLGYWLNTELDISHCLTTIIRNICRARGGHSATAATRSPVGRRMLAVSWGARVKQSSKTEPWAWLLM